VYRTLNDCSSEQLLLGSGTEPGKLFGVGNNLVIYTTKKDSSFNVTGYELFIYNVETRVSKTINLSPSGPNPSHLIEGDDALYFRTFETTGQCESRVYVESGIEINRLEIEGPNAGQVSKLFTIYDANDVQSGLVGIDSSNGKILVTFKEILGRTTACVASGFDTKYYLYDQNSRQVSELAVDEGNDEAFRADKVKLFVYP
jgi:hypothetical protein